MREWSQRITVLDAVCWKAAELGISYGRLSVQLTDAETAKIYAEYEALCQERREQERQRLEAARKTKNAKPKK